MNILHTIAHSVNELEEQCNTVGQWPAKGAGSLT
jgi:hypothetical protein